MATVTCHTNECRNADAPIDIDTTYVDEEGATQTVDAVICGACGQEISDIKE